MAQKSGIPIKPIPMGNCCPIQYRMALCSELVDVPGSMEQFDVAMRQADRARTRGPVKGQEIRGFPVLPPEKPVER
jgi:hypothetical protein